MAKRQTYFVQTLKGEWVVKKQGKKTPEAKFATKEKAIVAGKKLAKRAHPWGQLKIKGRDGRLQREHTYGHDPRGGG